MKAPEFLKLITEISQLDHHQLFGIDYDIGSSIRRTYGKRIN